MSSATVTSAGEIALPAEMRERHGLAANSKVRVVETRHGILLVPLTDAPMAPELAQELADWQSLGAAAWDAFSYNESSE